MKHLFFLFSSLLFLLLNINAQAPPAEWVNTIGGSDYDEGNFVHVDKNGDVYSVGRFSDSVDFDPSPAVVYFQNFGSSSYFISKSSPTGSLIWVKQIDGGFDFSINAMALDSNGNIFLGGTCLGATDLDPGFAYRPTSNTYNSENAFILKLNSGGIHQWHRTIEGPGEAEVNTISLLPNGETLLAGSYNDSIDFDTGNSTQFQESNGAEDIYILKLDVFGNTIFSKNIGGNGNDIALSSAIDSEGNIIISGIFSQGVDFDPSSNTHILYGLNTSSQYIGHCFLLKLDSSANFLWAHNIAPANSSSSKSLVTDINNNIYVYGAFWGSADFDPGSGITQLFSPPFGSFLSKFSPHGTLNWAKNLNTNSAFAIERRMEPMDIFNETTLYLVGSIRDTVDIDPDTNATYFLSSIGQDDAVITAFDTSGALLWGQSFGSTAEDVAQAVATDHYGNIYTTGYFYSAVNFVTKQGTITKTSNGLRDIFMHKIGACVAPIDTSLSLIATTLTSNEAGATYQWLLCSANYAKLNGADQQSYTPPFNGQFAVEIKKGPCIDTSVCATPMPVGMNEQIQSSDSFQVFPIPSDGKLMVKRSISSQNLNLGVLNYHGKLIEKHKLPNNESTLDLSHLESGMYFLKSGTTVKRIIIAY